MKCSFDTTDAIAMSTSRSEPCWQDLECKYAMPLSSLPPVASKADAHFRQRVGKLPDSTRYSDSQLSKRLADGKVLSLPELRENGQLMKRRSPRAHGAAEPTQNGMKNWSSALPSQSRGSWRQSTDSVCRLPPAMPAWSSSSSIHPETSTQQPVTGTNMYRSSSMRGPLSSIDISLNPTSLRKASVSMDELSNNHFVVITSVSSIYCILLCRQRQVNISCAVIFLLYIISCCIELN